MKLIVTFSLVLSVLSNLYSQDTLRLDENPVVILKSWYPEFKESPTLKVGEPKMLFTEITNLEQSKLQNKDINLKSINAEVEIKEMDKTNQYFVTVLKAETTFVEFEIWLEIGETTILLNKNSVWTNIKECYPFEQNRVMIQSIKLNVVH